MKDSLDNNLNISDILEKNSFQDNSFFIALENGEMSREQFIMTQYQFYYAVTNFTKVLSLVASTIPTYEERVNIIKNIWEEHGEGNLAKTHGSTLSLLITRLSKDQPFKIRSAEQAVIEFNRTLEESCQSNDYLSGISTIGMIERMFADMSRFIGMQIVKHGWLQSNEMVHYNLHQDLDHVHAEDFFSILRPHYHREDKKRIIDEGLSLGARTFLRLYEKLWQKVQQR
jgi:pyrroloquinoline-quinone synthase